MDTHKNEVLKSFADAVVKAAHNQAKGVFEGDQVAIVVVTKILSEDGLRGSVASNTSKGRVVITMLEALEYISEDTDNLDVKIIELGPGRK